MIENETIETSDEIPNRQFLILHEQIQFYVKENNTAYTLMIFENISNNNKIDRAFTNKFKPNKCK